SVGHDGFGSCSCDFQETPRLLHNLVADEVEVPLLWLGNHFFIRHRSLSSRVPVDHAATAINQPFPIKIDKNVLYSRNVSLAERKHASNVWRGHHDREWRLRRIRIRNEIAIFHPPLIPFRFNRLWMLSLRKLCHGDQTSKAGGCLQIGSAPGGRALPHACIAMP